ncbi:MAG: SMC-Scp complex subunit ScpB [Firmicutes bacterium]|nr:SMC-Scp complex subunit ScpB [Alicyclobacillaceae bacterium]MCL6496716.1 SMC-Scp complex subunit ScpB [Bacillota bacterium]
MAEDRVAALEALLFSAAEPVAVDDLAAWLRCTPEEVEALAAALAERLKEHALAVERVAGGFTLKTRPEWHEWLSQTLGGRRPEPLSAAAWETLAVVAYRQPVTRLEVETIRGVKSERALETLLARGLIEEVGRKEVPGRPILYATTPRFLQEFGLNRIEDLPPLSDPQADSGPGL